jgi:hypothetical protein
VPEEKKNPGLLTQTLRLVAVIADLTKLSGYLTIRLTQLFEIRHLIFAIGACSNLAKFGHSAFFATLR